MSIHDGHRQRLKKRFLEEGLDGFTEIQVLELLLFYCIPRQDTNPIAHRLLDRFGSVARVLDASVEELIKISGISENAATLLHLIPALSRSYQISKSHEAEVLPTLDACAAYILPYFFGRTVETVFLLCLDAKCKVLCCKEVGEGGINSTAVSSRRILEYAMSSGASSVVLAHNHPSGIAIPSEQDVHTTKRLAQALQAAEIQLLDHIIVSENDYVSMAQSGQKFNNCLLI